ncbi:hypothetical protein NCC78_22110 [Micromonospora phytophila]|uniref:hypothetical protein n=1 Tax=Micromonospora phytophila TaxID=709888 RepID=UPI00202FB993|nr:hypothetical protein [Micromonospora phytophila]MCM0677363.1 hypothetical protein [Micromonospora phytophila]
MTHEPVRVSRRIAAPAATIFRIVADPRKHLHLDGSGMLRGAVTQTPVSGVGDIFVMRMYYDAHGDYEMDNRVVEFRRGRRIAWVPAPGRGHPDFGSPDARWGQRWAFDLVPDGPDATVVTESYDCSDVPDRQRAQMDGGRIWVDAMTATLRRLDEMCTGRADLADATPL